MLRVDVGARVGAIELELACSVAGGECLVLAGPSGAGKSSVLRSVAGLLRPERGRIECAGETWLDVAGGVDVPAERRRVGYVFQDHALFGHLSALENVAYPLRGRDGRRRAGQLLDQFGLGARAHVRPRELSGGERQRVALARALAREPSVLLLDEPLSALDATTRAAAAQTITDAIAASAVPALLVTHDFAEAAHLGDRVAVVDRGRIVQAGTAGELAAAPASAFVADFTGTNVLAGVAHHGDGVTVVELDGGGTLTSVDRAEGPVAVTVHPWEIALDLAAADGSARNRLPARVVSVTPVGNRVRVGLTLPQRLAAEVTEAAVRDLGLARGAQVTATFKAAATRLVPR